MARSSISFSSILLSYFLVAGGLAVGLLLFAKLDVASQPAFYGMLAVGGLLGGFVAARGSRDSTIVEPAVGGLLVIASLVGVMVGTDVGELVWHLAKDDIVRVVAFAAVAAGAGALIGALVSERVFPGHTEGAFGWLILVAIAMFGACIVALIVLGGVVVRGSSDDATNGGIYFGAMALGALLTGLACGASAPRRILLVTLVGTVAGVMAFYALFRTFPNVDEKGGDLAAGFAVIGVGCGLIALVGAVIGWKIVGKRHAANLAARSRAFE